MRCENDGCAPCCNLAKTFSFQSNQLHFVENLLSVLVFIQNIPKNSALANFSEIDIVV